MSEPRYPSAPQEGPQSLGPSTCPPVADLIQYSLGQAPPEERRRIEVHQKNCAGCRGWIAKASRYRVEPEQQSPLNLSFAMNLAALPAAARAAAPDSRKWQRQALDELEKRLRQLEEEQ